MSTDKYAGFHFTLDVIGVNNTPIRVTLNDALDIVEFYDLRYPHSSDGQFICQYNVSTILEDTQSTRGLDLLGNIANWKIDARTFTMVRDWICYHRRYP